MKKLISVISITILLLSLSVTIFAGSVPEDLLHYDGEYEKAEQERMSKLNASIPEEAQHNLPKLKSTYANFAYWVIDNPTTTYAIVALILILLFGAIGFVIGYKIRKKKARR